MSGRRISFHYTLRDAEGRVLDTSRGGAALTITTGAGEIIDGLEEALRTMKAGERRVVVVPPEQGYGLREPDMVRRVPRSMLPVADVKAGDAFQTGPDRRAPVVTVVAVEGKEVVLDANHPLAGLTLHFDVEVLAAGAG